MSDSAKLLARQTLDAIEKMQRQGVGQRQIAEHFLGLLFEGLEERDRQVALLEQIVARLACRQSVEDLLVELEDPGA